MNRQSVFDGKDKAMTYKLKHIADEAIARHLGQQVWLEDPGDYNNSPAPTLGIPQQVFIDVISRNLPVYMESRQLLDQPHIQQDFRTAIIYWFDDCGIMLLLPEDFGDEEDWERQEKERLTGCIGYVWIGCRHVYDTYKTESIKICQHCRHIKQLPI